MKIALISFLFDGLSLFLNCVPQVFLKFFGRRMAFFWYWCLPIRVSLILDNLRKAYPEKSEKEIKELAQKNLCHYIFLCLEFIQLRTLSLEEFKNKIIVENREIVYEALKENRGIAALTVHLGNFEWLAAAAPLHHLPLHIIVRPLKSVVFEHLISRQRKKVGLGLIEPKNSMPHILSLLSQNKIVGFIFDQHRSPPGGIYVDFFGRPAATTKGLAALVERSNTIVLPVYSYRTDLGQMVLKIASPLPYKRVGTHEENIYTNTQVYSHAIEQMVRQHPEQWFWIHRRWKGRPEASFSH
ncbi:MAG: lysophospholipid acyltransferase family protein [Deltaproteobacteria bacterium]|nr:lysophospholipid acyltransferase family protein [Deltaproteobacteria bacterium]